MIRTRATLLVIASLCAFARAQCPDLNQPLFTDGTIYHVSGSDLLTVITPPFADNTLIGSWLRVVPDEEESARFFRITSNQHYLQNNTSVFSVAENLAAVGGSQWWLHSGQCEFDIFADLACPPGQAPQPGAAELDVNSAKNATGASVNSGEIGPYRTLSIAGGILPVSIRGETGAPHATLLLLGPLDVGHFVLGPQQIDLFLPQTIILGNGTLPDAFNSQFVIPASGVLNLVFTTPAALSGFTTAFQAINYVSGPGVIAFSNAVEVSFL